MASYIRHQCDVKDCKELDKIKSIRYLKRALMFTKNNKKYTYVKRLAEETFHVCHRTSNSISATENFAKFLFGIQIIEHETRFNAMFLDTPAMRNNVWKQPLFEKDIDMYLLDMQSMAFTIKLLVR
jgi:hypothetical protein